MNRTTQYIFDLILVLTQKEMKVRYKNNVLGYLWSIINPLAFALVFFIAFKVVMRVRMENYTLFLITGLFPWQWLSNSINSSPKCFISNAPIIKKVNFPRSAVILASVLQDTIHFLLAIPVIILFMFIYHKVPSLKWLYGIPILLVVQFLFAYGISLVLASANLFFRDLERLTGILVFFVFYLTPIIYPAKMVPDDYKFLLNLNPVAPLIMSWRDLFIRGVVNPESIMISFLYGAALFMFGHLVYSRLSWKFAEVL
ncbi:MAG: ABC transporter permease [Thermodesulfobacteriota bacterium]